MPRYLCRTALEFVFEARDANEAVQVIDAVKATETFAGHRLNGQGAAYVAEIIEEEQSQEGEHE